MQANKCTCGATPNVTFKIPKKKELCNIICPNCKKQSGVFSKEYQALTVWNNVMTERRTNL